MRLPTPKVHIRRDDLDIREVKVCEDFNLAEFLKNSQESKEEPTVQEFVSQTGLISLIPSAASETNHVKVTGFFPNVRRVSRMIEFYDDYISKLGTLEQKYRQERH